MSEECLRVLSGTASHWALWRECTVAEALYVSRINELSDLFLIHNLDLVVLVRCTETIEEVNERNLGLQCCQVRNGSKVHNLLY